MRFHCLLLLLIACLPTFLWGQTPSEAKLYGYLVEYPSQQPLANFSLMSRGANPTATLNDGSFDFSYRGKVAGDKVFLVISQTAYRIARFEHPIPVFLRKNAADEPITIELCKEGQCPEDEIRRQVMDGLQGKVDDIQTEIRRLPANSDRLTQLQDSLTDLVLQIQEMEGTIRELSRQVARSEFGPALPVQERAIEWLKQGHIDSAIWVLEQAELKQNLRRILLEEGKTADKLQQIRDQKAEHISALLTLARTYGLENQRDSAVAAYRFAIAADTSQYDHRYEYAQYLQSINRYPQAIAQLHSLLDKPLEAWQIANAYGFLGEIYEEIGQLPPSRQAYEQSERQYRQLVQADSSNAFFAQNWAVTYEKLGGIFEKQGQLDSALFYYQNRSTLGKELFDANPRNIELYGGVGISYYKLGKVYAALEQYDSTRHYYEAAYTIFADIFDRTGIPRWGGYAQNLEPRVLQLNDLLLPPKEKARRTQQQIEEFPSDGAPAELAGLYGNLSWYLLFTQELEEAEVAAREALRLDAQGAVWAYTNLASALVLQGRYDEAEPIYRRFLGQAYDEERSWREVFAADVEELEEAGITHPDMKRVRQLLEAADD